MNNMNNMNTNDPRLTAYALGELEEGERVQLEALLAARADLRAEVESIRAVASELHDELMCEPTPALSGDQREAIRTQAGGERGGLKLVGEDERTIRPAVWWWRVGISGAAAVLLLGVFVPLMSRNRGGSDGLAIGPNRANKTNALNKEVVMGDAAPAEVSPAARLDEARRNADELGATKDQLEKMRDANGGRVDPKGVNDTPELLSVQASSPNPTGVAAYSLSAGKNAPASSPAREERERDEAARGWTPSSIQNSNSEIAASLFGAPGDRIAGGPDGASKKPAEQPVMGDIPIIGEPFRRSPVDDFEMESGNRYNPIVENDFLGAAEAPLSTFSIDVDTAAYSMVRRQLRDGYRPSPDSVRLEEMINYFDYAYDAPSPGDRDPFRANVEVAACPWQPEHRLVRVGIKGMEIPHDDRPATNLVFLLDVSGSMSDQNKLPLVKQGLMDLVDHLTVDDRVAIVVYAGASGLVLDSTFVSDKDTILGALDRLGSGGSTNGGAGIELAYKVAQDHFIKDGVNRVILATDGDFNVGVTNNGDLIRLIEDKAKSGVFLTTLGFGTGNLNDAMLEQLADKGNGMCAYIDTIEEAQKVLIDQMSGSLVTIAKDVKIQVEFNPAVVQSYRLLGYENRALAAQDFNDDTKDAGEIGAGHTVTALYEVALAGGEPARRAREDVALADDGEAKEAAKPQAAEGAIDPLRYQQPAKLTPVAQSSGEMLIVKLRYKQPAGDTSTLVQFPVHDEGHTWDQASGDFKFAASVAAFGMILRDSAYKGAATFDSVMDWARAGESTDAHGYRKGFVNMVGKAKEIIGPQAQ